METNPFRLQASVSSSSPSEASRVATGAHTKESRETAGPVAWSRGWIRGAVAGKVWWLRAPLLLPLGWIFWRYVQSREYHSIFDGLTLGFHEAGHAAFSWFGNDFLTTAGGTIFQIAIPLVAALYLLLKQRDPFGATVGTFWMGTSLVGAGVYAADARAQALPLVSPFGPVDSSSHDWTVMLLRVGKISRDQEIGGALAGSGLVVMACSLLAAVWVLRLMARGSGPATKGSGVALYDPGEEARLSAFLSGQPVEREIPKRLFKRSKDDGSPSPSAPVQGRAGARAGAPENTRRGGAPAESEEERFRKFLERGEDSGRR